MAAGLVLHCGDNSDPATTDSTQSASGADEGSASAAPNGSAPATAPAMPGAVAPGAAGEASDPAAMLDPSGIAPAMPAGGASPPAGPSAGLSPEATAALSGVLDGVVQQGDAPGVVALVVGRDGVLFEDAAGQSDVAGGEEMAVDAIFNIASMTKPVTSVAAMILVERGLLSLDEPVSTYLPEFATREVARIDPVSDAITTSPSTVPMTVRHLMSHTSGIGYAFASSTVARLQQEFGGQEWQLPLLDEPGTKWHYSASTRVLGMIVEQLSGQSLEAFFQAEIFGPLNMPDTSFAVPAEKQARVPTLHVRGTDGGLQESAQNGIPATPTPPFGGDGGLYSTASDYGRFMRMFLNGGTLDGARILSESSVAAMGQNQIGDIFVEQQEAANPTLTKPFPLGAGSDKFGLGFQITQTDSGGASRSVGSLAWAGLFNTEFWIDPQRGVAATLLMQVLPFYDDGAIRALTSFEGAVYRELSVTPAD